MRNTTGDFDNMILSTKFIETLLWLIIVISTILLSYFLSDLHEPQ